MSRIAVDFDGTLVTKAWPGIGEWFPGAIRSMHELREAGHHVFLYSSRLNPCWPDGRERDPGEWEAELRRVREMLDSAGLAWMEIFTDIKQGKPHFDLLIDDKAMFFPGRPGSWSKILPAVLLKVGDEDSFEAVMAEADRRTEDE